jgi:hypothetical protein
MAHVYMICLCNMVSFHSYIKSREGNNNVNGTWFKQQQMRLIQQTALGFCH